MQPRPHKRTKHQTSFFAHEVFDYFLPAQKVIRLAGERGEAKKNNCTLTSTNGPKARKPQPARGESQEQQLTFSITERNNKCKSLPTTVQSNTTNRIFKLNNYFYQN